MHASVAVAAAMALLSAGGAAAQSTWTLFFVWPNGDRVYATTPSGPTRSAKTVTVRIEFARPRSIAGIQVRSMSESITFNCAARRGGQSTPSYFSGSNLSGEARRGPPAPEETVVAGSGGELYMRIACVDLASASTAPRVGWFRVGAGDGLIVRATLPVTFAGSPVVKKMYVQTEYAAGETYRGIPVGSKVSLAEVRCATRDIRDVWTAYYAERDMAGSVRRLAGDFSWEKGSPGTVAGALVTAACEGFTQGLDGPGKTAPTRRTPAPVPSPAAPRSAWTRVFTHPSGNQVFVEPASPAAAQGVRAIRVRHEYAAPPSSLVTYLSTLSTYEVRCAGREYRQRNITFYAGRNLSGPAAISTPGAVTFAKATAGREADAIINAACVKR